MSDFLPTETELQQLFNEAQALSDAAQRIDTPAANHAADEAWQYFSSALFIWEERQSLLCLRKDV